jgi:hypothetical protein
MHPQQINCFGSGTGKRRGEVWSDAFQVSRCWGTASFGDPTPRSIHDQHLTHSKREHDRISLARCVAREQEGTIRWHLDDGDVECCGHTSGEARRCAEPRVAAWANTNEHSDKLAPRRRIRKEHRRTCDEWLMRS